MKRHKVQTSQLPSTKNTAALHRLYLSAQNLPISTQEVSQHRFIFNCLNRNDLLVFIKERVRKSPLRTQLTTTCTRIDNCK